MWAAVDARKIKRRLEQDLLQDKLRKMPAKIRQYAAYEYTQRIVKKLLAVHPLVIKLVSSYSYNFI